MPAWHQNHGNRLVHAYHADGFSVIRQRVLLQATDRGNEGGKGGPIGAGGPAGLHEAPEDGGGAACRLLEPDTAGDNCLNDCRVTGKLHVWNGAEGEHLPDKHTEGPDIRGFAVLLPLQSLMKKNKNAQIAAARKEEKRGVGGCQWSSPFPFH